MAEEDLSADLLAITLPCVPGVNHAGFEVKVRGKRHPVASDSVSVSAAERCGLDAEAVVLYHWEFHSHAAVPVRLGVHGAQAEQESRGVGVLLRKYFCDARKA